DDFDLGRHLVDAGVERVGEQPHLFDEDAAVEAQELALVLAHLVERLAESHVVERDAGALVERPVRAFLQRDPVVASVQPVPRARMAATSIVASTPTGARPTSSAASRPCFSSEYTFAPTSS